MQEYTAFCDNEVKDKAYAIQTAEKGIEEAKATIADSEATVSTADDEIATLGTTIAAKEKELAAAQKVRAEEHENFVAAEKELVTSIDQLGRAVTVLKKGSFMQMHGGHMDKKIIPGHPSNRHNHRVTVGWCGHQEDAEQFPPGCCSGEGG